MVKPITKAALIQDIANREGISNRQASACIDATINAITAQLIAGNCVALPGLAKFEVRHRPERQVRNVATGKTMTKAADRALKIRPLTNIKAALNS